MLAARLTLRVARGAVAAARAGLRVPPRARLSFFGGARRARGAERDRRGGRRGAPPRKPRKASAGASSPPSKAVARLLKRFYLKVHPDLFGKDPTVAAHNTAALSALHRVGEHLRALDAGKDGTALPLPPAGGRGDPARLSFYFRPDGRRDVERAEVMLETARPASAVAGLVALQRRLVDLCAQAGVEPTEDEAATLAAWWDEAEAESVPPPRAGRGRPRAAEAPRRDEDEVLDSLRGRASTYSPVNPLAKKEELRGRIVELMVAHRQIRTAATVSEGERFDALHRLQRFVMRRYPGDGAAKAELIGLRVLIAHEYADRGPYIELPWDFTPARLADLLDARGGRDGVGKKKRRGASPVRGGGPGVKGEARSVAGRRERAKM